MIQTDFFETLLKRVQSRSLKPMKTPAIAKSADQFEFYGYKVSVLRRAYQRSLGVIIKPNGLIRVTASKSTSSKSIWRFLKECESWIEQTQGEYRTLREKYPAKNYFLGESFHYLGRPHQLVFLPGQHQRHKFIFNEESLCVFVAKNQWNEEYENQAHPELRSDLVKFYEKEARKILKERVIYLSEQMELYPKKLSFRAQKTRWGSCGSNGHVSLNWKLIAAPLDVLDYVVIHELAHLKYQNHGPRFWQLVERYSPKHKSHRRWLSKNQYEFDFLSKVSELHD